MWRCSVIDDGSPDGTGEIATRLRGRPVACPGDAPYPGARPRRSSTYGGFRVAVATDAHVVCQMDADLSHDPTFLPAMFAAIDAGAELVIGSRYLEGGRVENWPVHRMMLSGFANRYIRAVTGLRVRGCTSGFRCWRRPRLPGCGSTPLARKVTPFSPKSFFRPPQPAPPSPRCRLFSWSVDRVPRSSRRRCCSSRSKRPGGSPGVTGGFTPCRPCRERAEWYPFWRRSQAHTMKAGSPIAASMATSKAEGLSVFFRRTTIAAPLPVW